AVLGPQGAAFRGRRCLRPAHGNRWVAAGVRRVTALPVVDDLEARALAAADVEGAIGTELEVSDGVTRILLTPVLDQHVLGAGHHVARRLQARQTAADNAAIACRARARIRCATR